jgi:hypothetical protein
MRKELIAPIIILLFLLSACGGAELSITNEETNPPSEIDWEPDLPPLGAGEGDTLTNIDEVFGVGNKSMTTTPSAGGVGYGEARKTADSFIIDYLGEREVAFSVFEGDFKDTNGDYITAVKESSGRYSATPSISYKAIDSIFLGGKRLGLEHSDFGFWSTYERAVSDGQGSSEGSLTTGGMGFCMGDASQRSPGSSQLFYGKSIAQAHGGGQPEVDYLTGTALMSNINLIVTLNDFATFSIPITVSSGGKISAEDEVVNVTNKQTNRDLSDINITIEGQFYGSEAVGTYYMSSGAEQYTSINGSFGLKLP